LRLSFRVGKNIAARRDAQSGETVWSLGSSLRAFLLDRGSGVFLKYAASQSWGDNLGRINLGLPKFVKSP
jgi:hypothetical protein